jgi:hypothetical protein
MSTEVKPGTTWWDGKGNKFIVLGVHTRDDDTTWVYYREDKGPMVASLNCREFSCLVGAFIERFREIA